MNMFSGLWQLSCMEILPFMPKPAIILSKGLLEVVVLVTVAWRWCSDLYGGYSFM